MGIKTKVLLLIFVMLTMPANSVMSTIRYQIPAILERGDVKTWTNGSYGVEPRVAGYANIPARPKTS